MIKYQYRVALVHSLTHAIPVAVEEEAQADEFKRLGLFVHWLGPWTFYEKEM